MGYSVFCFQQILNKGFRDGVKIDPLLQLALSLSTNPGRYALLLGSGLSTQAKVLTGWGITLDLISRIATADGQDPMPDPESWYLHKFGKEPNYSELLQAVGKTQTERMTLLKKYFEPDQEEREKGIKLPTKSHRSIAQLVKSKYIRVILTTNFDRLLETALQNEGIVPDVISTDDQLHGSIPYTHSQCYLVKLHGDYLDTRIRNTEKELTNYSKSLNTLVRRLLDDHGLIICGWSGHWDIALRKAIESSTSRRFATYWMAHRGKVDAIAKQLIDNREATHISIDGADEAFLDLLEKVTALADISAHHPMTTPVAIDTVKRMIPLPENRIRLHDIVTQELERVHNYLNSEDLGWTGPVTTQSFQNRMHQYEASIETLAGMLGAVAYHGAGDHEYLLSRSIERLLEFKRKTGNTDLLNLQYYPSLLLAFACGASALASRQYNYITSIFIRSSLREKDGSRTIAITPLHVWKPFEDDAYEFVPGYNQRHPAALSLYVYQVVGIYLSAFIPSDAEREDTLLLFEYLLALLYWKHRKADGLVFGRFAWEYRNVFSNEDYFKRSIFYEFIMENRIALAEAGLFSSYQEVESVLRDHFEDLKSRVLRW